MKKKLIYIDGKNETDRIVSYSYNNNQYGIIFNNSNKKYFYNENRLKIIENEITEYSAHKVFNYLSKLASIVGLQTNTGENMLARSYQRISTIRENSIFRDYLNGTISTTSKKIELIKILPFGFNLSQKNAIDNTFSDAISIVEGPPGTGKTQTILNIIINAILNEKIVAVVSSNNSATKNIYEKFRKKGLEFIIASLGSYQNKKDFIDSQIDIPDLSKFALSKEKEIETKKDIHLLFDILTEHLITKNKLAKLKQEFYDIKTEYKHFQNIYKKEIDNSIIFNKNTNSHKLLKLWISIKDESKKGKKFNFIKRFIFRIQYGIRNKSFLTSSFEKMILTCQWIYYRKKIFEIIQEMKQLKVSVKEISFENKMKEYTELSMHLVKSKLYKRYNKQKRQIYTIEEINSKSSRFIKDYPIIMSTTYSLRESLSKNIFYDYLIIDEASQVDIVTGGLALSCAKQVLLVGDLKQLPNVVDPVTQKETDLIFDSSHLPEPYRYSNHSILSSMIALFPSVPKVFLKEHYRCHPKIIEFCNKKFYDNQLIILTELTSKRQPLIVYKTPPGNHAREKINQREIDIIQQEIIPHENLQNVDLGIVTPYRKQTDTLQKKFYETSIKVDTVDKFQGRENQVIILSTVDNSFSNFSDNPNRLNVAVSRAIEQLILVVNGNDNKEEGNIVDLIGYIEYNNFSVTQSNLNSIFDYLYKGYKKELTKILSQRRKISKFDSENLMYNLIIKVLSHENFSNYDVISHFSMRHLIKDFSKLDENEKKYASHPLTHLDFLIYNKFSKYPILAIEVDGFAYHKEGTQQAERDRMKDKILEKYTLPLLRLPTNGSREEEKLKNKLCEVHTKKHTLSMR